MKKLVYIFLAFFLIFTSGFIGWKAGKATQSPSAPAPKELPLDVYSIENLSKVKATPSMINLQKVLKDDKDFTSYLFSLTFPPNPAKSEKKKVTGQINIPKGEGPYPVVVMLRGYVDQKIYKTGDGTRRAGEYFAKNGFISLAPDFLGYGQSDEEAGNIFESRFQTYTTALALLNSLGSLNLWNKSDIFLWGHSNGGQIAISILEATGADYPTTLWAPVSKPFPYSVLYYTDESDDKGKLIRSELAKFEDLYNPDLYSIHKYFDRIKAPIQLHQGAADDAVPRQWSDYLADTLLGLNVNLDYFTYPGADHNLNPSWDLVVQRDLAFFSKHQGRQY